MSTSSRHGDGRHHHEALCRSGPSLGAAVERWLIVHSIPLLRISLGAVFLGFGVLKYFPGVSPAQGLAVTTTQLLTFGLVPDNVALVGVATLECLIGVLLLSGRAMGVAIGLLTVELVGILSPLVLMPAKLFAGSGHAPTLEGQYVLKDLILVAAVLVVAATLRGARLVPGVELAELRPDPAGDSPPSPVRSTTGERSFSCAGTLVDRSDLARRSATLPAAEIGMSAVTDPTYS